MSARVGDENLLQVIKRMDADIKTLKAQGVNQRRNDIRIGDLLMTWDKATNQIKFQNLKTGGPAVVVNVP